MTPPQEIVVEPLARHRHLVPLITGWFESEWPSWYGPGGPGSAASDVTAFARSEVELPVGMVAFAAGEPVGAGALKTDSIPSHRHLSPWAAAGFVLPSSRGHGIGAKLLGGIVRQAAELGFPAVYCGTSTATNLLRRCGWTLMDTTQLDGKELQVFRSAV